jgi:hypothetical protein
MLPVSAAAVVRSGAAQGCQTLGNVNGFLKKNNFYLRCIYVGGERRVRGVSVVGRRLHERFRFSKKSLKETAHFGHLAILMRPTQLQ